MQLRSDLAHHLGRATFPADREQLAETLARHHAPRQLLELASSLPAKRRFASLGDVVRVLGLPVEERRRS